jgi:hypothetical protein
MSVQWAWWSVAGIITAIMLASEAVWLIIWCRRTNSKLDTKVG